MCACAQHTTLDMNIPQQSSSFRVREFGSAVTSQERNVVLDHPPTPINNSENDLTRKERVILAQIRWGYCRLLEGSFKSIIKKDASLSVCSDCGKISHDVKHLFVCPAHPTTLTPSDIWSRPTDSVRKLSYPEVRDPY